MGPEHHKHFSSALTDLLGGPTEGAVAFLRCLPSEQVDALADAEDFAVLGWTVNAVVDKPGYRRITADQAVEQREDKANAALFLIDPLRAGAGLDGIYNAAREIREPELFKAAQARARKELRGRLGTVNAALKRAERLGRRRKLTPWQEFDFMVAVGADGERRAIASVGLWPVQGEGTLSTEELDLSVAMADRLLFPSDARTVGERVRSLLLDNKPEDVANLERFLRPLAGRSPEEAAAAIAERPEFWLGSLKPRFSGEELQKIILSSWRKPNGGMQAWSGLRLPGEDSLKPTLLLDRDLTPKERAKLTVRWTIEPAQIAAGGVEYRVSILAGEEVLTEQTIAHRDKPHQQAVFSLDDFEDLEGTEKFEALVQIAPVAAEGVEAVRSEEFVLEFGVTSDTGTSAGSGQVVRALVEGAAAIKERSAFDKAVTGVPGPDRASEDKKGFIIWKGEGGGRAVRVARPLLIRNVEEDWAARRGTPGRWVQKVRADGAPSGAIDFVELQHGACDGEAWRRVCEASRRLAEELGPLGLLGRVKTAGWRRADEYVNAWLAGLESGGPDLALHGTVEVKSLSGRTLGLLVTPLHPLRFAWSALYDNVAAHARYEENLESVRLQRALKPLDSANFPFALPGIDGGRPFLFADVLGFHAVAMTLDGEPEPKGAVAVLGACLGGGTRAVAPSVGTESAYVLAREVRHFLRCHEGATGDRPDLLNIQAWRPGDGMTVARALGQVLNDGIGDEDQEIESATPLCFTLDLYHPPSSSESGRFLSMLGQRRRSGGGVLEASDRWMTETATRPGGVLVPRLRWSKRPEPVSNESESWAGVRPTHLSMIFDVFEARLEVRPASDLGRARPLHVYGLTKALERRAFVGHDPEWMVWMPPELSGERAPDGSNLGERLRKMDTAVARLTARALGGGAESWPVLVTRLSNDGRQRMDRLHECSDWVITADRNAALEYFDAPHSQRDVYQRFVIDAVPERADLGSLQLVTSTTNLDAMRDLVDEALDAMGLSGSARNTRFLVNHLKALSGRLAIRLANAQNRAGEMIALALVQANCVAAAGADGPWVDLARGFLLPVDEIADFAPIADRTTGEGTNHRADFIHVAVPARGPIEFRFIEVKHRLHLRSARDPALLEQMLKQTGELRRRWSDWFFGPKITPLDRVTRRSQLARLLRFYADRAARHRLSDRDHSRLLGEIDALVLKETYIPGAVEFPDIGYVFCPEHRRGTVEPIYASGGEHARFYLFGPGLLPDGDTPYGHANTPSVPAAVAELAAAEISETSLPAADTISLPTSSDTIEMAPETSSISEGVDVLLGTTPGGEPVEWRVSIKTNPHLMVAGLPGMGKTTALVNICRQLTQNGVAPIVFSFHDDIDEKLARSLGPLHFTDFTGLGFNPLRVDGVAPTAYVDVTGTLRDIFASIFPDLGDLQLEELRQAIKQSFEYNGWGRAREKDERPEPPAFRTFFDILRSKQKPNANLLARLQELADYGFFDAASDNPSLLAEPRPTIIRVHSTTNSILQNAFSSFVLYSLYKDMFRRGVQSRLTHAIIFDEAHRAAKLKLIPQFAKECRKYGLSLALASQGAKDFSPALFEAVGSYLMLRVTEADARAFARNAASTGDQSRITDRLKSLEPYNALFLSTVTNHPRSVRLLS
ncbi:AAA domain-containing protein (plasmid) [Rhizobium phaseoli]|uniref:ATP-binding protein n=1 Tax=Rhizobium phaseoli TaxID=396 RepID=UPI0007F09910|nr:ATP-binding protein [Rhizobium phaseoli]ANL49724.1 AAA domain-containing protein [Rhizobium phaseoli]